MKKKRLWLLGLLVILIAAGAIAYRAWAKSNSSSSSETQTAQVEKGSISSSLSASGNTRTGQSASVAWQTSGQVGEIDIHTGDLVQKDQVLVSLDPNNYSMDLFEAKQNLVDAQQALEDLLNSKLQQAKALQSLEDAQTTLDDLTRSAAETKSQAQLTLANAQEALADAQRTRTKMNYPHSTDKLVIEKAETDYLLAKQAYKEAKQEYIIWSKKNLTNPDRVRALNQLVAAEAKMKTTLATYNWYILDYTPLDIAQADAALAVAQANLELAQSDWDRLKDGASSAGIALAEASLADAQREWERLKNGPAENDIAAAQALVDSAQAAVDQAQLRAPFTGTITQLDAKTGDLVKAGDSAFRIDDLGSIFIDLQISEVDLASLQIGQKAAVEFDAIPDKTYNGEVTAIGMVGTVSQGVVNFTATVKVTDADEKVRPGMTASVTITTAEAENALLVPNQAIRNSAGQQSVVVLFEGQQYSIPVTVGLTDSSMSQVTSDQLREGDTVVIKSSTASTSTTSQNRRTFEGPGGGGFIIEGGPPNAIVP